MPTARRDAANTFASLALAIAAAATSQLGTPSPVQALQVACDSASDAVQAAENERHGNGHGNRFQVVNVSPDLQDLWVRNANLRNRVFIDIEIEVQASAQTAALYLSAAGDSLNLNSGIALTIAVAGDLGSRILTFSSGTMVEDVAAAINSFRLATGVHARASGTGVRMFASGIGSDRFVSVQVLEDGGSQPHATGIYQMMPDDVNAAHPSWRYPFWYTDPITDSGQDVLATLNGFEVDSEGASMRVRMNWLNADILLQLGPAIGPANAQTLGTFTAFRVERRD